ncbi:hypothetical protein NO2_0526 [Candidatus Termititenax persephonae]|uniref:Uncharacterized protein n=1 Tax=Candidatus Termititenax persephonae TaxID=2218525 RepID=A0A388THV9_9BACT|nr:hypothetical protein NO2_0526 [Candidatus Termititenax persephonae]
MFVYYRLSDKSHCQTKLAYATKKNCLLNALREFGRDDFYVIADNCQPETIQFIRQLGVNFEETKLGNSGSFAYMLDLIFQRRPADELVYLLEDDYLHRPGSKQVLAEGLKIADYVTLYDHPDKYRDSTGNPFEVGGRQKTRLSLTPSAHWRETNSTTMTFACAVKTLYADRKIWRRYLKTNIPQDFYAFTTLTQNNFGDLCRIFVCFLRRWKKRYLFTALILLRNLLSFRKMRKLISPLPGYATHAEKELLAPLIAWEKLTGA